MSDYLVRVVIGDPETREGHYAECTVPEAALTLPNRDFIARYVEPAVAQVLQQLKSNEHA